AGMDTALAVLAVVARGIDSELMLVGAVDDVEARVKGYGHLAQQIPAEHRVEVIHAHVVDVATAAVDQVSAADIRMRPRHGKTGDAASFGEAIRHVPRRGKEVARIMLRNESE